jgi:di/tricarboxylate transporter
VDILPFAVTLMIAASACFATPIGYQTNLMVYGPGNYRFMDFVKIGLPLTALVGVVTVLIVPIIWPF